MAARIPTIKVTVRPNGYGTRGRLFDAELDGRVLVRRSAAPFCDAARLLLAEGVDPATKLVMRHSGSEIDALRSTIGAAAKLTVSDDNSGKPRFRSYRPWSGPVAVPGSPPMRQIEEPVGPVGAASLELGAE
jgi:hypothetical protein